MLEPPEIRGLEEKPAIGLKEVVALPVGKRTRIPFLAVIERPVTGVKDGSGNVGEGEEEIGQQPPSESVVLSNGSEEQILIELICCLEPVDGIRVQLHVIGRSMKIGKHK